jgi:Outer membrane protein beta-barrel domain
VRLGGAAFGAGAAIIFVASPAGAVEQEKHLGVDLGASILDTNGKADFGGAAGVHWTYGLNDAFDLIVEGTGSLVALKQHDDTTHSRPTWVANADVGVGYVFDVLRWVPYLGVLAGGYVLSGGTIDGARFRPGVEIEVGLDYRLTRSFEVGVTARQHMLFTDMSTYPSFTQVLARAEYTWGW